MKRKSLTNDEVSRLQRVLKEEDSAESALLGLLLDSGMRAEEVLRLTPNQFSNGFGEVSMLSAAKGSNIGAFLLSDLTQTLLQRHFSTCPSDIPLAAFLWPDVAHRSRYKALWSYWVRLRLRVLGDGSRSLGLHCFRHTTARLIYEQTKDLSLTQAILRHKSIASTQHYLPAFRFNEARTLLYTTLNKGGIK